MRPANGAGAEAGRDVALAEAELDARADAVVLADGGDGDGWDEVGAGFGTRFGVVGEILD
ncbi:hypothetical protein ACFY5C_07170 [Streptomyces sp. NPDC012935]|uniref:hypothetical protein n=1 Tax=Streptomyces sp. NPDC012935 TaxID=3364857 RepID=UPI003696FE84